MREPAINSIGVRYGRVVVQSVRRQEQKTYTQTLATCLCDCGQTKEILLGSLKLGRQKSCGCFSKDNQSRETHGQSKKGQVTTTYRTWLSMMTRCYNSKTEHFHCYGGRGILVDDTWHDFNNFFRDMGERPIGTTLDRINNELGYSKDNCRWADKKTQSRNRSTNRLITYQGETKILTEWCEIFGINFYTVLMRLDRSGWDFHRAITQPVRGNNGQGRQEESRR